MGSAVPALTDIESKTFSSKDFRLENGQILPVLELAYETYGTLNANRDNAVLVVHGYTSSHHAAGTNAKGKQGRGVAEGAVAGRIVGLLDQMLLVFMIVEILYTVQVSFREHALVPEPFLIVGLIAVIRRILVLTAEFGDLLQKGETVFRNAMLELGLLTVMVVALVVALVLLRKRAPTATADSRAGGPRSSQARGILLAQVSSSERHLNKLCVVAARGVASRPAPSCNTRQRDATSYATVIFAP